MVDNMLKFKIDSNLVFLLQVSILNGAAFVVICSHVVIEIFGNDCHSRYSRWLTRWLTKVSEREQCVAFSQERYNADHTGLSGH